MALKQYNPRTPSMRALVSVARGELAKGGPEKHLTTGLSKHGGRNNTGRITARRRGGGHKRKYRVIDFRRARHDVEATVLRIEYDPNRSAFIALIEYTDGERAYILAPQRLAAGDTVVAGAAVDVRPGNAMPLAAMPLGTIVHNIEMKRGKGGQMARAAGTYAPVDWARSRLCPVETELGRGAGRARRVHGEFGAVSNPDQKTPSWARQGAGAGWAFARRCAGWR